MRVMAGFQESEAVPVRKLELAVGQLHLVASTDDVEAPKLSGAARCEHVVNAINRVSITN
jgi:hypothetical protein